MTKCATQTLGMIQLMQDFNIVLKGDVHTDFFCSIGNRVSSRNLKELGIYMYNTFGSKRGSWKII